MTIPCLATSTLCGTLTLHRPSKGQFYQHVIVNRLHAITGNSKPLWECCLGSISTTLLSNGCLNISSGNLTVPMPRRYPTHLALSVSLYSISSRRCNNSRGGLRVRDLATPHTEISQIQILSKISMRKNQRKSLLFSSG